MNTITKIETIAGINWYYAGGGVCLAAICAILAIPLLLGVFYSQEFQRLFESAPPLLAKHVEKPPDEQPVEFESQNGRALVGGLFPHRSHHRSGLIIFCHEYTGNRRLFLPYVDYLRDDGFDIFTFDFANHGESETIQGYQPLQWVTEHEVADVAAAVDYVITNQLAEPGKIGVFGVSKGGSAAVVAAARDPRIKAVVTDGAFPTHSLVAVYVRRWINLVVLFGNLLQMMPQWVYDGITRMELAKIQRRRNCRYPHVESCFKRLSVRPLFLIHGKRDNYIRVEVIQKLFNGEHQPEEIWIVTGAKHNQSIEIATEEYQAKVRAFFLKHLNAANS